MQVMNTADCNANYDAFSLILRVTICNANSSLDLHVFFFCKGENQQQAFAVWPTVLQNLSKIMTDNLEVSHSFLHAKF